MKKETIIHYAVMAGIVVVGVLVANNWVQPMLNSSKVAPPTTTA